MSAAADTLRLAARSGVRVTVDGGSLVLDAPTAPPATLIEAIRQHKAGILALLTPAKPAQITNGVEHDDTDWAERAAVIEYDAGIPRKWAEAQARLTRYPPDDVTQRQWDLLRDDFGRFCDEWAGPAGMMGWQPADLLGWDPHWPYSPIAKHLGPIWKFDGATVVEIRRDAIVIARHGARSTLPRRMLQ